MLISGYEEKYLVVTILF